MNTTLKAKNLLFLGLVFSSLSFLNFNQAEVRADVNQAQNKIEVVENEFIVKLKDNNNEKALLNLSFNKGKTQVLYQSHFDRRIRHVRSTPEEMKSIQENYGQMIEYIEPVYRVWSTTINETPVKTDSTPAISSKQWGLENSGDVDVNALEAWKFTEGSNDVVVAVVDSGIDYNHPDLKNSIWKNEKESSGNKTDDDHNGYVDDTMGWDFYSNDPYPYDYAGHGTHVSGVIAANGPVIKGVAPHVKIMPLRFLGGNGSGTTAGAIRAIDYAIKNGANIINASWGGGGYSSALRDAIVRAGEKGILFVTSSGNASMNLDGANKMYPASFNLPNMIVVGAVNESGTRNSASNFGAKSVHVAAPGTNIYSTYLNGKYAYLSGTSMACPFASGALALIWSYHPELSASEVKDALLQNVKPLNSLHGYTITGGMVDAAGALNH